MKKFSAKKSCEILASAAARARYGKWETAVPIKTFDEKYDTKFFVRDKSEKEAVAAEAAALAAEYQEHLKSKKSKNNE